MGHLRIILVHAKSAFLFAFESGDFHMYINQ